MNEQCVQIVGPDEQAGQTCVLAVGAGARICALPLENVDEVMRPLPTEPVPGTPSFLRGLALIRGVPTPVVDLASLIDSSVSAPIGRYVTFRFDERRLALAVDGVFGLRRLRTCRLHALSPLFDAGGRACVASVAVCDRQLLFVLQAARIIPDELWNELGSAAALS